MVITSNTNIAYNTTINENTKTKENFPNDKITNNQQQTRYEKLLDMKWEDMTEAERTEKNYYNAMRPVSYLDEEGNKALNKALQGKTDIEKFQIKGILELEFMTSIKVNAQGGLNRQKFDINTSRSATENRIKEYLETYDDIHSSDSLGIKNVLNKFLNIYKASEPSNDLKNQEDSVVDEFLEDLYSKESISFVSSVTKEKLESQVKEFHQSLEEEFGDSPEAKSKIGTMLNDYRKQLLEELKTELNDENSKSSSLEKQSIVKVLLDNDNKTKSPSLESLLQ